MAKPRIVLVDADTEYLSALEVRMLEVFGETIELEVIDDGFNTSNHSVDIKQAQSATGKGTKGSNMTWHHNEDGKTLQLVPREYHEQFRHRGGFSLAKGG